MILKSVISITFLGKGLTKFSYGVFVGVDVDVEVEVGVGVSVGVGV